jgi:hypothetical protein
MLDLLDFKKSSVIPESDDYCSIESSAFKWFFKVSTQFLGSASNFSMPGPGLEIIQFE